MFLIKVALISLVAGFCYTLGYPNTINLEPPYFATLFTILGMAIEFNILRKLLCEDQTKSAFFSLYLFSLAMILNGYSWLPFTVREFGNIPTPFNYFVIPLAFMALVPYWFISLLLIAIVKNKILHLKTRKYSITLCTCTAFILTLAEEYIPSLFPSSAGAPWFFFRPYLGLAPFGGLILFSFINYLSAALLSTKTIKGFYLFLGIFVLTLGSNRLFPIQSQIKSSEDANKVNIRIIQANIGNKDKLQSEEGQINTVTHILNTYEEMSLAHSSKPIDLLVWPETAYPFKLNTQLLNKYFNLLPLVIKKIRATTKASFLFGGYSTVEKSKDSLGSIYNSAIYIPKGHKKVLSYNKQKLLNFGETLPFGPFNKLLKDLPTIKEIAFFERGTTFPLFKIPNRSSFIPLICYESLQTRFIKNYLNFLKDQPNFIVNITNDGWYIHPEPTQHEFFTHWSGIIFQLPIVRSTNTGITAILFPDGTATHKLKRNTKDTLDFTLQTAPPKSTFYALHGNLFCIGIFFLFFIFGFFLDTKAFPDNVMES